MRTWYWPHLLRTYPMISAKAAAVIMQVSVEVAAHEIGIFRGYLTKPPTWLQLFDKYPKISEDDAAYVMGVGVDAARQQLKFARNMFKRMVRAEEMTGDKFAFRTSGTKRIACKIVGVPLRSVKVSDAEPDASLTREFKSREENATLNVHRGTGVLASTLDADAVRNLPSSIQMVVQEDQVGKKHVDTHTYVLQDPRWYELPKSFGDRVKAMSLEDRIEIGDLSLTNGDSIAMMKMQRELAVRRQAEATAKAA